MIPVALSAGSNQTININVGAGGSSVTSGNYGINGSNTTITFNAGSVPSTVIATAGGGGGKDGNLGNTGGSGGGGGHQSTVLQNNNNSNNFNYGNMGGYSLSSNNGAGGGGGGAGLIGQNSLTTSGYGGNGGNGIQCFLPGISNFSPSGTAYGTYYWGGGGGGSSFNNTAGNNNGGLGGGGGGNNTGTGTAGLGGGSALNTGGIGVNNNGSSGTGGANTGGGGGGSYTATSGAGGSGIVIIAFPSATAVSSNQSAVLPASIVSSGLYSATLNNATLSSLAYNSIKGAYACRLLNYNYFGPVMTLRHSLDTTGSYTQNFYSDICGNIGTGYLGTGLSLSNWLSANGANTTYAFVTKWYNQGMDVSFNCATQYTLASQPIYDVANGILNFGYNGSAFGVNAPATNCLLNLPATAFPLGDSSYTITIKHGYMNSNTGVGIWEGGATGGVSGSSNILLAYYSNYINDWWNGGVAAFGVTTAANNVVTAKYTSGGGTNSHMGYVNGTSYVLNTTSTRNQLSGSNFIGFSPGTTSNYFNGQLYYMYISNIALTDADLAIIEATPYQYSQLPIFFINLIAGSVTTSSLAVSTSYSGASFYTIYVNSSYVSRVTSLSSSTTITTPLSNNLNNINIYAYNATNNLIATNSGLLGTSINSVTATISSTVLLAIRLDVVGGNEALTKLLHRSWGGSNYSNYYTYYNGSTWTTTLISVNAATMINGTVSLSSDGTIGLFQNYVVTWTGTTPSTPVTYAATYYEGNSMSADGSRIVMSPASGTNNVYTWNGSTYVYSSSFTLTNVTGGGTMSPDGKYLFTIIGGTIYYATWNGTTYANETTNVCSALTTFWATSSQLGLRGTKIGAGNTIYISVCDYGNVNLYIIAVAYNKTTGYWDRMYNLYSAGGFGSDIIVPRYNQTGKMIYSYSGNTYSGGLLVT